MELVSNYLNNNQCCHDWEHIRSCFTSDNRYVDVYRCIRCGKYYKEHIKMSTTTSGIVMEVIE